MDDPFAAMNAAISEVLAVDLEEPEEVTVEEVWSCADCGRKWSALEEAHCAACHHHFSSDSAFDTHQRIDHKSCQVDGEHGRVCRAVSVCRDPSTLLSKAGKPRLECVESPYGIVWARPGSRPPETIPGRTA